MNPRLKSLLRNTKEELLRRSLVSAAREQGLWELAQRLRVVAGGFADHYTGWSIDNEYLRTKVACQHAFQVLLTRTALSDARTIVDIGDSSGAHTLYLKAVYPDIKADFISVNLDPVAVDKIKAKGLKAVLARAEDLPKHGIKADVFLLFETLEHLSDPFNFLHELAASGCSRLVLTVPFVRRSRLGLDHIREGLLEPRSAEKVHLLELSPEDLRLLFSHTGWRVEAERIYWQAPGRSPLRALRPYWARCDYEGFYGAVLSPDDRWARLYTSWPNHR